MPGNLSVTVLNKRHEAKDVVSLELGHPDRAPLPAFSPGSHVDVHIPGDLIRQYSLCNDASERHRYRIAVLREPATRGGSLAIHELVKAGDQLVISSPRNAFPLVEAERTLLFAGGIGVTPLLSMAVELKAKDADFELHYCTRSIERTPFRDELLGSAFAGRVHFHLDDGPAEQRLNAAEALGCYQPGTHIYVCGPTGFIEFIKSGAKAAGFSPEQIHFEHFSAAPQDTSGDSAFTVRLASTGQLVTVQARQTVVEALAAVGIEIFTSCGQGVCGTCITRVLDGECDHRDAYLPDDQKALHDQFTPCVSRARTPLLVLDL